MVHCARGSALLKDVLKDCDYCAKESFLKRVPLFFNIITTSCTYYNNANSIQIIRRSLKTVASVIKRTLQVVRNDIQIIWRGLRLFVWGDRSVERQC
jgi:hypothetical protein